MARMPPHSMDGAWQGSSSMTREGRWMWMQHKTPQLGRSSISRKADSEAKAGAWDPSGPGAPRAVYLALLAGLLLGQPLFAKCELTQVGMLPVTMEGLKPTVVLKINGADAKFVVDSGGFYSMINYASARQYKLEVGGG